MPSTTVPAVIMVRTGPVSGPATNAPRPCSQNQVGAPVGQHQACPVRAGGGDLRPHTGDGIPQRGGGGPFGVAGRKCSGIHLTRMA